MATLSDRENSILELIMESYINIAEPIGSRTISVKINKKWSPATIRNTMVSLEEQGYLYKPHIVAGRIPTQKAFRYYINKLLVPQQLGKKELSILKGLREPRYNDVERVMEVTSRMLAEVSNYPSIVVEPKVDTMTFKEIEFVKLSEFTILILFVTSSGIVHTRIVRTEESLDVHFLQRMRRYMNERFEGVPFHALKEGILDDMEQDRERYSNLLKKIKETLDIILGEEAKREIYIEGASNIINIPEFSDIEKLRELFQALESKERLLKMLDSCLNEQGISVIIGMKSDVREISDLSIITSTYQISENSYGILGVIGPIRMNYSKIIPIVNYTARAVTNILNTM